MKRYYKQRYCLSEQGAKNLSHSTWLCFLTYCVNLGPIFVLMYLMDQLVLDHPHSVWQYVVMAMAVLVVMYIALSKEYAGLYNATYKESAELRKGIAETLVDLPMSYLSKHNLSDLSQAIMSDVERIEHAMSHSIPKVMGMCLFFPVMGLLMLIGHWKLGAVAIIPVLLSFVFLFLGKKNQEEANRKYFDVLRDNSELFQETIELQQEISSFNQAEKIKKVLYKKMQDSEKIHIKVELGTMILFGVSSLFSYISVAVVIAVGLHLLVQNEVTLLYLMGYIIASIKMKELFDISREGILEMFFIEPAVKRIREIQSAASLAVTPLGETQPLSQYDIEFNNVSFCYDKDTPILKGVSFMAKQGEVTALVGMSGSGKTSILRLISRLYEYDEGHILIGGQEIKKMSPDDLFKEISIVFQDVTLFNSSVLENIRLGQPTATDEVVKKAAKLANCMDFIEKLPNGFDTFIGENGAELSGGERQRLSIARAFLKDAPILILDEISASLDVENEKKIQDSLNQLIKNKTVIIISHRLKSIENVDKIVVLDQGYIETIGKHSDLLNQSKVYKSLIEKTQLAESFYY